MLTPKKKTTAFLCHCHEDRKAILALWSHLKRDGVEVWLDKKNLFAGQDWERTIRKAILQSDVIIVGLSRRFNKEHGFRHEELRIALQKAKWLDDEVFIIPVRFEKCDMPESLQHLLRVDFFTKGGYRKLLRALRG